jgi:hypothetical protein
MGKKKKIEPVVGDPTPRSVASVCGDPAYEGMTDYEPQSFWPSANEVVVRHKETATFWRAVYKVRENNSDVYCSASWTQVQPQQVTVTKYVDVV